MAQRINRELIAKVKKNAQILYVHATKVDGGTMEDDIALQFINHFLSVVTGTLDPVTPIITSTQCSCARCRGIREKDAIGTCWCRRCQGCREGARNEKTAVQTLDEVLDLLAKRLRERNEGG